MLDGGNRTRLTLLLCAALQVILKLILRIKLRTANGALIRLARFMFFWHMTYPLWHPERWTTEKDNRNINASVTSLI